VKSVYHVSCLGALSFERHNMSRTNVLVFLNL